MTTPRLRTGFFNVFRYLFKIPALESFLVSQTVKHPSRIFRKFIPPVYLYRKSRIRVVERDRLNYKLDISRLLDHSIFFGVVRDLAWGNLFKYLKHDAYVVDTGANIGYLTLNFARICCDGYVFSFEPDLVSYNALTANVRLNQLRNVKTFHLALGAHSGAATLYKIHRHNPGTNRILPEMPSAAYSSEEVEVRTLDDIAETAGITRIDLWKIDVEGYEMSVLKGGTGCIRKWRPVLFIELVDENLHQQGCSAISLIEFVEDLGYEVFDARTMEPVARSTTPYDTDIICFFNKDRIA